MKKDHWQTLILLIASGFILTACQREGGTIEGIRGGSVSIDGFMPEQVRAIYRRSCQSCHGLDGRGIVGVAPDLKRVRYRGAAEWERYLRNPQSAHPVSRKPPVWLDDDEMKIMAEYLSSMTQRN